MMGLPRFLRPVARDRTIGWSGLALAWGLASAGLAGPVSASAVTDWNQQLQVIISLSSANLADGPPEVAREMAIVTAAMFDAVNAASGSPYASYAYTGPSVAGVSQDAAALTAGYQAVRGIFTNAAWQTPAGSGTAAAMLANAGTYYNNGLTALGLPAVSPLSGCASPSGALIAVCGGISLGTATAAAVTAKQANDGSAAAIISGLNPANYIPPTGPGGYIQPTARPAMFPTWGTVTPTGISTAALQAAIASTVPGPPALNSAAYASGLLRTECVGSGAPLSALPGNVQSACAAAGLAPDLKSQTAALFWNDPGGTSQPPGHWLQITNSVIQSQNLDTLRAARLSMLVSMAENNAGIATWEVKYQNNLWRPVTAIQSCDSSGTGTVSWNANFTVCDASWTSLIATPPHPDYIAGHPAFSGAAAAVLGDFFGTDAIAFSSTSQSYCNGGAALRGADQQIDACLVPGTNAAFAKGGKPTIFTMGGAAGKAAGCANVGGVYSAAGVEPTCMINAIAYVWSDIQPSCNDIVLAGGANDSPLICPITENFASFTAAVTGPEGSELSRIAGGIHTPSAAADAAALGFVIGAEVTRAFDLPDPPMVLVLGLALAGLGTARWRRISARTEI